ncbi:MAG: DegT/DnrJ/EryC1/StrS family aminotransferase, partial [Betaproteobacteria bacterium]
WNAHRQSLAHTYMTLLGPIADEFGIVLPAPAHTNEPTGHSWNMYCVLLPFEKPWQAQLTRKQFIAALHAQGIGIGISYEAMHLTSLFRGKGHREGEHPMAERIAQQTVTLPLHAAMTETEVARVVKSLISFLAKA